MKDKRLENARNYIGYCIKEGFLEPADYDYFKEWSKEEIINFAEDMEDKANLYYDLLNG